MAKELFDFNLDSLNLFIGLQCGNRLLRPYSTQFRSYSFQLFALEKEIQASDTGKIKPELIINSIHLKNTLLLETSRSIVENKTKNNQLERYAKTEKENLVSLAQLPAISVSTYDIVFVVTDNHFDGYSCEFEKNNYKFPLHCFRLNGHNEYELELKQNTYSTKELNEFFKQKITVSRIPAIVPFDLGNPSDSKKEILESSVNHLLKLLQRKKYNDTFSLVELSESILTKEIWSALSIDKKKVITEMLSKFISNALKALPFLKDKYFSKSDNIFSILLPDKNREEELKVLRKALIKYANKYIIPELMNQLVLPFKD